MKEIMELSEKNKFWVIEDSAQSLGSHCVFKNEIKNIETKKFTGTIGHIGTTSFTQLKILIVLEMVGLCYKQQFDCKKNQTN